MPQISILEEIYNLILQQRVQVKIIEKVEEIHTS